MRAKVCGFTKAWANASSGGATPDGCGAPVLRRSCDVWRLGMSALLAVVLVLTGVPIVGLGADGLHVGDGISAVSAAEPPSTPDPDAWVTDQPVRAIAGMADGSAYIGGEFTYVGPNTGGGVRLDTATGAMAGPLYGATNVLAAVSDGSGGYFIGGGFTSVAGVARNNIAHILADGSVDPSFDPDANNTVYSLALSGSTLYVGGSFSTIGGQSRANVAALDTTTGNATPWDPGADSRVDAIAVSGPTVYAGGGFGFIGGASRNYIAAIEASSGAATAWNPNANGWVWEIAASGSTIYAGGQFSSIGGQTRNNIAALDGSTGNASTWNPNANQTVYALAVSGSTVYVGGTFTNIGGQGRNRIAAVDASTGNATGWNPNADSNVRALAVSGSTVYAGGWFSSIGGEYRQSLAAIDMSTGLPTAWNPTTSGGVSALAVGGPTVFAGGTFRTACGFLRYYIARVLADGTIDPSFDPDADGSVLSLAVSGSTVYAGGWFSSIGGQTRNRVAALDASTGSATTWNPSANGLVSALAVSGSTVYAGGQFTSIGGQSRNRIAALDASTGSATTWNPNANAEVRALAVSGSTVYAGGDFSTIGGQIRNSIAALDASTGNATSWNPNGNGWVQALGISGSTVYAGGWFQSIGGQNRNMIAAIDASTGNATGWDPSASTAVRTLAVSGSTVHAGGAFQSIGGEPRDYLAAVSATSGAATSWDPDVNNEVRAVAAAGSVIYAGGDFNTAGGKGQPFLARFGDPPPTVDVRLVGNAVDATRIDLAWAVSGDASPSVDHYEVRDATTAALIDTTPATFYSHSALTTGTTYSYEVRAIDGAGGVLGTSNVLRTTPPPGWSRPLKCDMEPNDTTATARPGPPRNIVPFPHYLGWVDHATDADYYELYCEEGQTLSMATLVGQTGADIGWHGFMPDGTPAFSYTGLGSSQPTAGVSFTVPPGGAGNYVMGFYNVSGTPTRTSYGFTVGLTPQRDTLGPTAPTDVTVTASTGTTVKLSWGAATDDRGPLVYGVVDLDTGLFRASTRDTSVTIGGLTPGNTYRFGVGAADAGGNIGPGVPVTATAAPPAPGSIGGTVTDGTNPLQDITVDAWKWNGASWDWHGLVGTRPDGTYSFAGLPPGSYRVRFSDKANRYRLEFYDDQSGFGAATTVVVTEGVATTGIDAVLASAGKISGTVRDFGGVPIADITVDAWRRDGGAWTWQAVCGTRPDGSYTLGYLPADDYRIRFSDKFGRYLAEFHLDAASPGAATNIPVTPGGIVSGTDATLAGIGRISGTIRNESAVPLPNVMIDVWRKTGPTEWTWHRCTGTKADGTYSLWALPVGTYRLRFTDKTWTYRAEYYNDKGSLAAGDDIVLSPGTHASGTDAVLSAGP